MATPHSFLSLVQDAVRHEKGLLRLVSKSASVIWREGLRGIAFRVAHLRIQRSQHSLAIPLPFAEGISYDDWLEREHEQGDNERALRLIDSFEQRPTVSIICPVYNPIPEYLEDAIDSVLAQLYPNWQLCIADDASNTDVSGLVRSYDDGRIAFVRREQNGNISAASNSALELASGDYVTFLDQDDLLSPYALFWVVERINQQPGAKLLYSDEDKITPTGDRCDPFFKPDWNYDYLLGHNYLCHLCVYDHQLVRDIGRLREGYEGAQDYDLALRAIERLRTDEIAHVPRILYHWRQHRHSTSTNVAAKPYALDAGKRAVESHLRRQGVDATVDLVGSKLHVTRSLPRPPPTVTIVIPTRDNVRLLRNCIDSVLAKTRYAAIRIVIVDNGSRDPETLDYLAHIDGDVICDERPFNFSALVNTGVSASDSDLVCLMNNDIEVVSPEWLRAMVEHAYRDDVGAVGAKLLYDDDTIQHAGVILGVGGVAGHAHKYLRADSLGYYERLVLDHEVSAVTGACMLVKRCAWEAVNGFDEDLAVAFNDIDFCLRLQDAGYRILWTPRALLYHHESKSRGHEDTLEKQARFNAEREQMKRRWGDRLNNDPAYNPNLSLATEDFAIAAYSRNPSLRALLERAR